MNNRRNSPARARSRTGQKLSNAALASYLTSLADLNDLPGTRNLPLADALRHLAKAVRQKTIRISDTTPPKSAKASQRLLQRLTQDKGPNSLREATDAEQLSELTAKQIRTFIEDESKTKNELLRLATLRFSMPSSQLRRSTISEVRQAILSALLHESSMDILSQEAQREGKARSS